MKKIINNNFWKTRAENYNKTSWVKGENRGNIL